MSVITLPQVKLFEQGKLKVSTELGKIEQDLETKYIRSSMDSFEYMFVGSDKVSKCEGVIRYHPFLYDRETKPQSTGRSRYHNVANSENVIDGMMLFFWIIFYIIYCFNFTELNSSHSLSISLAGRFAYGLKNDLLTKLVKELILY